jgi:hypothetical protein
MNVQNDISEELRLLSELVATISRQTPYRVADDYFPDLPSRVMLRIGTNDKPMVFNVPEGYFEGFADGVLSRIKAGAAAGTQAGAVKDAVTTTAPGTSESAAAELAALSPLLAQLKPLATYRMPEGYFEEFSPILTIARNTNPYTVPEEYFHQLPTEIEEKVLEPQELTSRAVKKPAKVVAFGSRRTNWLRYSVAAVVAGLILTIGWLRFISTSSDHGSGATADVNTKLMKVSDQELQNFLATDADADDDHYAPAQPGNNVAALNFNDGDIKSLLGEIPDGELRQYIDEYGRAADIATN